MVQSFRLIVCSLSIPLLLSCASINPTSVSDEDRDQMGKYDGTWQLVQRPLSATQTVAGQRFKCNFRKKTTYFYVKGGVGRITAGGRSGRGNVSKDGRFRVVIPTDSFFTSSTGVKDEGRRITHIYQGKLGDDQTRGLFTIGKKSLNNSGCSTRLTIENYDNAFFKNYKVHPRTKSMVGNWSFTADNIPETAQPSRLKTELKLVERGDQIVGELLFTKRASSSCGELVSKTSTKVIANLVTEDKLILTVTGNTPRDTAKCADHELTANWYSNNTKILLQLVNSNNQQQLLFKSTCGWTIKKRCVFQRPPLVKAQNST